MCRPGCSSPPSAPTVPTRADLAANNVTAGSGDLQSYARQAAQRAGIDPDLFSRQIQQESGFDPSAQSPAGALGIAQIVPQYHPGVDTSDPYASLDYAANLMAATPKASWPWVRALLHSVDDQPDATSVHAQFDRVLDALADKLPRVAEHLEAARADVVPPKS